MNALLADVSTLYLKTKNLHWHISGPHFRDYHLLLDEQADELFAMTDPIAERIRNVGGSTLRSIGHISRLQRLPARHRTLSYRSAAKARIAQPIGPLDVLIAATSLAANGVLITRNLTEFRRIPGLNLQNWYE